MSPAPPAPRLETARLVVRIVRPTDAAALADYCVRNREHLSVWEPTRPDAYYTVTFWQRELELLAAAFDAGMMAPFAIFERDAQDGEVLGRCTLSNVVRGAFQAAHLGYSLDCGRVGQGVMSEALRAVITYAFDTMNLHRLMANYMPTNERSGALLRRLGFTPEGYARDYLRIAGAWRDHVLTSLTNDRWKPTL